MGKLQRDIDSLRIKKKKINKMLLQINTIHTDYNKHILPYTKNGIFIDTSIMKMFLDGFIKLRFSKVIDEEYQNLISIFDYLKVSNKWSKFWITPHIFTEICRHFCQDKDRNKRENFYKMVEVVIPILKELKEEENISKEKILNLINKDKPIMEIGDLSIFVSVDNLLYNREKIAIIEKDKGIKDRFENYPNVMVIDYFKTVLDLQQRR